MYISVGLPVKNLLFLSDFHQNPKG